MASTPLSAEAVKEKRKLLANNLDRASSACLALGVFGPVAASYFGIPTVSVGLLKLAVGAGCWALASLALHQGAQFTLNNLR